MLSPRYLAGLSDELIELYAQLETDILVDMARRIARLSKISDATQHQAQILIESGLLKQHIARILRKYDRRIIQEIQAIFTDAMIKNAEADNRVFVQMTGRAVSDNQAQMMLATIQKTHSDLSRLTLTTAETTNTVFIQKANAAYLKVASGAFDYNTAMKQAAHEIAQEGVSTYVTYNNTKPVKRTIESAVRMNILTGVNQTAAAMTVNNCEQAACDLVEVTAHIGARPDHAAWQGKIYSLSGTHEKYPPFSICGYGEITGICGVNCRHSFYPYYEGMEPHYTKEDLEDMQQTVTYNGKRMSRYTGDQQLRSIERRIRYYKREAAAAEAMGQDTTAARQKIGEWQAKARDFTKQTGIRRDYSREYVGTKNGKQPKGIHITAAGYTDNAEKAKQIKRLSTAKNKVIAQVAQGAPMNFRQADGRAANPHYNKNMSYQRNCQSCVVTYELRRRGFDVETLPNTKGSMLDVLAHDTRLAWIDTATGKNPQYIIPAQKTVRKAFDYLKNELKTENRYTIQFIWKNKAIGHIIHLWKNKNNIISLYDPQNGINTRGDAHVLAYLEKVRPSTIKLMNVQQCDINMNVVNKIVQGASK